METQNLILVDLDGGVVGIEHYSNLGVGYAMTCDHVVARFRCVTETLAEASEWNPVGFRGGMASWSAVGPLELLEMYLHKKMLSYDLGKTIALNGHDYVIRPCSANLIPLRLWERETKKPERDRQRMQIPNLRDARRQCFAWRVNPVPLRVYFGKGTTRVSPPVGSVARIGNSESSQVVFLDMFGRPIRAFRSAGDWEHTFAEEIPIPSVLDYSRIHPLGRSPSDLIFGVSG